MSPQQEQDLVPQCTGLLATLLVPPPPPLAWGHVWWMLWLGVSQGSAVAAGSLPQCRVSGDTAALINGALSSFAWWVQWLGRGFKAL